MRRFITLINKKYPEKIPKALLVIQISPDTPSLVTTTLPHRAAKAGPDPHWAPRNWVGGTGVKAPRSRRGGSGVGDFNEFPAVPQFF